MKNSTLKSCRYPLLLSLALVAAQASAARVGDPLAPIVRCVSAGPFKVLEKDRFSDDKNMRYVDTLEGKKPVSVQDGYRLLLASAQGRPFVNFKIELSDAKAAQADRDVLTQEMKDLASGRKERQPDLQRSVENGIETLSLHQADLTQPGPLSRYNIFVPDRYLVSTLYVLNQAPETRAFATWSAYEKLRDQAVHLVQGCLVKSKK